MLCNVWYGWNPLCNEVVHSTLLPLQVKTIHVTALKSCMDEKSHERYSTAIWQASSDVIVVGLPTIDIFLKGTFPSADFRQIVKSQIRNLDRIRRGNTSLSFTWQLMGTSNRYIFETIFLLWLYFKRTDRFIVIRVHRPNWARPIIFRSETSGNSIVLASQNGIHRERIFTDSIRSLAATAFFQASFAARQRRLLTMEINWRIVVSVFSRSNMSRDWVLHMSHFATS